METEIVYSVGDLWGVGICASLGTAVVVWFIMALRWEFDRDRVVNMWRGPLNEQTSKAEASAKKLEQYRRAVRLAQEHLESVNEPKVDFSVTYTA